MKKKKTFGVYEWAKSTANFQKGCKNGCVYCYACKMAIRFKRVKDLDEWTNKVIVDRDKVNKNFRTREGWIMFPTSHDIYQENMASTITVLSNILIAGNKVLIVTKPEFKTIKILCDAFINFTEQINWRFTITSRHDETLKLWEPHAPSFTERMESLRYAFTAGFKTSVSIEPFLDPHPWVLIELVAQYVQEIWLGVMNSRMLPPEGKVLYQNIKHLYTKEAVVSFVQSCQGASRGKLRLKDSIRKLLGEEAK